MIGHRGRSRRTILRRSPLVRPAGNLCASLAPCAPLFPLVSFVSYTSADMRDRAVQWCTGVLQSSIRWSGQTGNERRHYISPRGRACRNESVALLYFRSGARWKSRRPWRENALAEPGNAARRPDGRQEEGVASAARGAAHGRFRQPLDGVPVRVDVHNWHTRDLQEVYKEEEGWVGGVGGGVSGTPPQKTAEASIHRPRPRPTLRILRLRSRSHVATM